MRALVHDNLRLLDQGLEVVRGLPEGAYAESECTVCGASIGAHLRHILDHYASLLAGVEAGVVDYDERSRDREVELDVTAALGRAEAVRRGLLALADAPPRTLGIQLRGGGEAEVDLGTSPTSTSRELHAVLLHTVHHYAIIAAELRGRGLSCPPELGVAPATLGWRRARA